MPGKSTIYRAGLITSLVGLLGVCAVAAFPIYDGLATWYRYRTPDNLGLGIGFVIIMLFGTPFMALLLFCRARLRKMGNG